MTKMSDNNQFGSTGVLGTIASVVLFMISRFALTDLAAVMTIIVAGTTAVLNIQKYNQNRKRNKKIVP